MPDSGANGAFGSADWCAAATAPPDRAQGTWDYARIAAHSEVDRHPESAFRAPQHLPVPAHWPKSGLCFHWVAGGEPTGVILHKEGFTTSILPARVPHPLQFNAVRLAVGDLRSGGPTSV